MGSQTAQILAHTTKYECVTHFIDSRPHSCLWDAYILFFKLSQLSCPSYFSTQRGDRTQGLYIRHTRDDAGICNSGNHTRLLGGPSIDFFGCGCQTDLQHKEPPTYMAFARIWTRHSTPILGLGLVSIDKGGGLARRREESLRRVLQCHTGSPCYDTEIRLCCRLTHAGQKVDRYDCKGI